MCEMTMADESNLAGPPLVTQNGDPLRTGSLSTEDQAAQIEALKTELESLKQSISAVASTAKNLVGTSTNAALEDAEEILKRNVFASVGIAAFIGYLWGKIR
jgi:ElaB/YqjD/DUF883 family membrane-anchored ribosome-binding protein